MLSRRLRLLLGLLALVVALIQLAHQLERQQTLEETRSWWQESGIAARNPEGWQAARRAKDPMRARVDLARALLADGLDLDRLAALPPDEALGEARRLQSRLETARLLAEGVLARNPTSWEAATILGGVALLERLAQGGDPTRDTEAWETPLLQARTLAPHQIEPRRLEAVALLTRWHALSDAERETATTLFEQVLQDPISLRLVLPGWMALTDRETLFRSLPDTTLAWSTVADELGRQGRWTAYCDARSELDLRLRSELEELLTEARARRAGGDAVKARRQMLQVLQRSRPSREHLDLFETALLALPPGPVGPTSVPALENWAEWGLGLSLYDHPTLTPAAYRRLAGYGRHLPPVLAAWAALEAGDLAQAETIERRTDESWSEAWAPYMVAKARHLAERGEGPRAADTLDEVHRLFRSSEAFLRVAEQLGVPIDDAVDRAPANGPWPRSNWSWRGHLMFLHPKFEPTDSSPVARLRVDFDQVSPPGTPIEIQWDGRSLGCWSVEPDSELELSVDPAPGVHRLTLEPLRGATVQPGRVRLAAVPETESTAP